MILALGSVLNALAAAVFLLAWWRSNRDGQHDWRWLVPAAIVTVVALQHALNLDAVTQNKLRALARAQGVYESRRLWQLLVVLTAVVLSGALLARIDAGLREIPALRRSITVALVYAAFDFTRWVSLHQIDAVLYYRVGPFHINHLVEAVMIILCVWAAFPAISGRAVPPSRRGRSRKHRRRR